MDYINDEYGARFFKPKFDFTMKVLFHFSDRFSTVEVDGRKQCLTIKELQGEILESDTFGVFGRKWDYGFPTIRRYIKRSRVQLERSAYNDILNSGTKYMKYQGIKERSSFSEELMRVYMRYVFNAPFDKAIPSWLKGMSIKGGNLELDGYNERLKIAFECDGPDHYDINYIMEKYNLVFDEALERLETQRENDRIKDDECAKRGITLIRLKLADTSFDQFQTFIEGKFQSLFGKPSGKNTLNYKKAILLIRSGFLSMNFYI